MQPPNSKVPEAEYLSRRTFLTASAIAAPVVMGVAARAHAAEGGALAAADTTANGKVAVVTGSSRGIGAAIVRRLARDGYKVTINYVGSKDQAMAVLESIQKENGEGITHQADVSDPRAVIDLFEATEKAFGGVDVVVSNAGIMRLAPFAKMTDADFDRMMNVNVRGGFYVLREAARRVRDGGRIIALSSSITQLRSPTYGPYAASKAAQELYANILAKELEGRMISVNAIAPGVVNTPLFTEGKTQQQIQGFEHRTPHKRLGEPEDIANVVSILCSSDGAWINGQVIFANGGIV